MTRALKDCRIAIMMSRDELKAVDDWMFAKRLRSRGEATRRLISAGLTVECPVKDVVEKAAA